ncbi:MAG: hypothetical protein IPI69_05240 [Bacteroidales bacterium]|nr:hypothetical protein [Bacteroidales bacterium]
MSRRGSKQDTSNNLHRWLYDKHIKIRRYKTHSQLLIGQGDQDEYNRRRGLMRLEKQIKAGRLTKSHINKRGYNKYLRLTGDNH